MAHRESRADLERMRSIVSGALERLTPADDQDLDESTRWGRERRLIRTALLRELVRIEYKLGWREPVRYEDQQLPLVTGAEYDQPLPLEQLGPVPALRRGAGWSEQWRLFHGDNESGRRTS